MSLLQQQIDAARQLFMDKPDTVLIFDYFDEDGNVAFRIDEINFFNIPPMRIICADPVVRENEWNQKTAALVEGIRYDNGQCSPAESDTILLSICDEAAHELLAELQPGFYQGQFFKILN